MWTGALWWHKTLPAWSYEMRKIFQMLRYSMNEGVGPTPRDSNKDHRYSFNQNKFPIFLKTIILCNKSINICGICVITFYKIIYIFIHTCQYKIASFLIFLSNNTKDQYHHCTDVYLFLWRIDSYINISPEQEPEHHEWSIDFIGQYKQWSNTK